MWIPVLFAVIASSAAFPERRADDFLNLVQGKAGSSANCGFEGSAKIVGGVEADPHAWPWTVTLKTTSNYQFCGGTLVDETHVVTAAHCVQGQSASRVVIGLGYHDKHDHNTGDRHTISRIVIHPGYSSRTMENDIAVITLDEAASVHHDSVAAACVSSTTFNEQSTCYTKGWGHTTSGGQDSDVLREVQVHLISTSQCNHRDWYNGMIDGTTMICAGYEHGGSDSCQGDSGGPLVCKSGNQWHLVGVTSWGFGCADPRNPGVYARVSNYLDWLQSQGCGIMG